MTLTELEVLHNKVVLMSCYGFGQGLEDMAAANYDRGSDDGYERGYSTGYNDGENP